MSKKKYFYFNIAILGVVAFLYLTNNLYLKTWSSGIVRIFFNYYFNDLICPGALLALTNLFIMLYIPFCRKLKVFADFDLHNIEYGLYHLRIILTYCFICGIYWELIYPIKHRESTCDVMDILFYVIGGTMYYYLFRMIEKAHG